MSNILRAPWNTLQIEQLTKRQTNPRLHEYTCLCCSNILKATKAGWVCKCGYKQSWCLLADATEVGGMPWEDNSLPEEEKIK